MEDYHEKKIFTLFFIALFGIILSVTASANPDGPKFTSPGQYSEHKIAANVVIKWNKPDAHYGTVDHYTISARLFDLNDDVTNSTAGTVILNQSCSTTSYTLSGSSLEAYYHQSPAGKNIGNTGLPFVPL